MTDLSARFPFDPAARVTAPRGALPDAPLAMPTQRLEAEGRLLRRLAALLAPRPAPARES
jgi:hypothetical protein